MLRKEVGWQINPKVFGGWVVVTPTSRLDFRGDPKRGPFKLPKTVNGRTVWIYKMVAYSTAEELDPGSVEALVLEAENRVKIKVARAKALMVQSAALDKAARLGKRPPIPDDVKMYVWQRDGGKCVRCGSTRNLEYDHDIPLSLGGSTTARNLRLLCETCNRSKGGSLL